MILNFDQSHFVHASRNEADTFVGNVNDDGF
jgi:hypothetical protein